MKKNFLVLTLFLFSSQIQCVNWEKWFSTDSNPDPKQYGIVALGLGISALGVYCLKKDVDIFCDGKGNWASKLLVKPVKIVAVGAVGVTCFVTGFGVVLASKEIGDGASDFINTLLNSR